MHEIICKIRRFPIKIICLHLTGKNHVQGFRICKLPIYYMLIQLKNLSSLAYKPYLAHDEQVVELDYGCCALDGNDVEYKFHFYIFLEWESIRIHLFHQWDQWVQWVQWDCLV